MSQNIIQISFIGDTYTAFEKVANIVATVDKTVKLNHIKSKAKLRDAIAGDHCQLIIGNRIKKGFDIFKAIEIVQEMDDSIPIIGFYDRPDTTVAEAMQSGLNDYVNSSDRQHTRQRTARCPGRSRTD